MRIFLERAGRREEAENVWRALAARHARNPQVLSAAGDFFERAGNSERARRIRIAPPRFSGCAPRCSCGWGGLPWSVATARRLSTTWRQSCAKHDAAESHRDCIPPPERILRSQPLRPHEWTGASRRGKSRRRRTRKAAGSWRFARSDDSSRIARTKEWIGQLGNLSKGSGQPSFRGTSGRLSGNRAADIFRTFQRGLEQSFAALAMDEEADDALRRWIANSEQPQAKWDSILAALVRMLEANWRPPVSSSRGSSPRLPH